MKRALWVTAVEPCHEARGGGNIRQAYLLDALAEAFETHLVLAGTLHDDRLRARLASVHEVPVSLPLAPRREFQRRLRDLRWTFADRQPAEVAHHRKVRRALAPILETMADVDLVCVEYLGLAPLLPNERASHWALTLHNINSGMARQNAAVASSRRQAFLLAAEERNCRRFEQWAVTAYDTVVAVSRDDAAALPPGTVVVPNGVDVTSFRPSPLGPAPRVAFVGALHTLPNVDGICWFCRDIWPRVRRRVPGATLDIVGARPHEDVLALGALEGVDVHADVPSVAPFLERSRMVVVPLRIGTGSRLKALEAMAAGRPVVGTRIGLEGLSIEAGRHALVADTPEAFAEAVSACLSDLALSDRLGRDGRALVETSYAWTKIGADYVSLLQDRLGVSC
jgi:glycosyltransferase involved in cell wall biosynthesis